MMKKLKIDSVVKVLLFVGIVALLFVPMFSNRYKLFEFSALDGSYSQAEDAELTLVNWLEGSYQDQKQRYIEDHSVFKPLFVRLYNQYYFDFYNVARANLVEVGKSGYLYEKGYINAHLGRDFIGQDAIAEKIRKLQKVVDTLKTKGVELLVVLAPGKASFYPEFIPASYNPQHRTITNYEVYNKNLLESNIHYLDFHSWFVKSKSTSKYPLFPKTGIHWSVYGELLAADSMISYINSISKTKKVPKLLIGEIDVSNKMRHTDDDIEKGMNLLFDIPDLEMAYPAYSFQSDSVIEQPKVVTIADSYYWGMFNWGLSRDGFGGGQFWYYNEAIYPDSYTSPLNVSDVNIMEEIEKNDVVVLISTDANLYKFAFGFIDQLYAVYFPSQD